MHPKACCYKLIQRFRLTGLFAGQYITKLHGTITGVIYNCWISFAEGLGEVSAHSFSFGIIRFWRELMPLFFVQLSLHQVETR